MNLSKLDVFAQIAASGSLTKAAVTLDTTPSAISRQLASLEKECGGRLFHRTGRGVALTELGLRILPRIQSLLRDADALTQEMKGSAGLLRGDVRLGLLAATAASLLPPLLAQLKAQHPGVMLRVLEGSSGQIDEWVASGHVDIALVARQGASFGPGEYPLATSLSCLVGPANDPLTQREHIDFTELHQVPLILAGLPNGMRKGLEQVARQMDVELCVAMEADSLLVQLAMVSSGCGYAILPAHAVNDGLKAGALTAALIVNPSFKRTVTLTATTQKPMSAAAREVFRLVREIAENLTDRSNGVWTPVEA